jgi:cation:H+ antiporter
MDIGLNLVLIAIGLVGLFLGGNWLVDAASRIARKLGLPPLIVGLTVVAFGTSMPELMVSVRAAISGSSGIALGNVIGSNIANMGLILGLTGLVLPITVKVSLIRREIPIMIGLTFFGYFLLLDQEIGRVDGAVLLTAFLLFNAGMVWLTLNRTDEQRTLDSQAGDSGKAIEINLLLELGRLFVGLAVLLGGAELTVRGASAIASGLGVSEVVIGLTLVAFGTSLPELAASLVAALRNQGDLAVGNVVGSNIANLLLILGATSLISPIPVNDPGTLTPYTFGVITFDYPLMFAFSILLLPFVLDRVLNRLESGMFLLTYSAFIVASFLIK